MHLMIGGNNGQSLSGLDTSLYEFYCGQLSLYRINSDSELCMVCDNSDGHNVVYMEQDHIRKNMFAVGSNPEAANVSGVNVTRTIILVFVLAGIMYGLTGFIESARIASNSAATGLNYELDAIAACVIGGVILRRRYRKHQRRNNRRSASRIIFVALTFLGIDANMQYIIKGLIILIACAVDMKKYLVRK